MPSDEINTDGDVIDFESFVEDFNKGEGGEPGAKADDPAGGETTSEEGSPAAKADETPTEGEDKPAEKTDEEESPEFVQHDEETGEPVKAEGETAGETPTEGETKLPEGVVLDDSDPLVSALKPIYEAAPEAAGKIHDIINESKELAAKGVTPEILSEFAQNHEQLQNDRKALNTVRDEFAEVKAYSDQGNYAPAMQKLGLDVEKMQDFFVARALAKEEGKLSEFEAYYSKDSEKVSLMMENQRLQRQHQELDRAQKESMISSFETKLRQEPLMAEVDALLGKKGHAEGEFSQIYAAMPENQRDLNKAFDLWKEKMSTFVSRFGGTAVKQAASQQTTVKKERPASLNPPSNRAKGGSPVSKRPKGPPRSEAEWHQRSYA